MKEPRTLFKLAALKKTCLLFENSDYRVGIKRGSPKRVEGHQCVEVELVFMNKLRNNINISVTLQSGLQISASMNHSLFEIEPVSKHSIVLFLRLVSVPYSFPVLRITSLEMIRQQGSKLPLVEKVEVPLLTTWFHKTANFTPKFMQDSVLGSRGVYLQTEFYTLDSNLFKGSKELQYFLKNSKQMDFEALGYIRKPGSTLLGQAIYLKKGYSFLNVVINRDGMFNLGLICPKGDIGEARFLIDHYLAVLSD